VNGIEVHVDGLCARCGCAGFDLVVVGGVGVCRSCLDRPSTACEQPPLPGTETPVDRCPLCGGGPAPAGAARWVIHVDEQPPTQNDFRAGTWPPKTAGAKELRRILYARAAAYSNLIERWRALLLVELKRVRAWSATGRRRVTFTRLLGPRTQYFDQFNLVGGLKPVVDALVHLQALVDDSPARFEGYVHQRRCEPGERPGLRVELVEL
jgi:hypothetical protein